MDTISKEETMRSSSFLTRLTLLLLVGLVGLALDGAAISPAAHAQSGCTISWVAVDPGNGAPPVLGGSWGDVAHWDQGRIPGPSDHVCITLDGDYTTEAGSYTISDLTLQTASGTATLSVFVSNLTVTGSVYNAERINPASGTKYFIPDGPIPGTFTIGGTLVNHGLIEAVLPDSSIYGSIVNEADGVIRGSGGYGMFFHKDGATFINRGTIGAGVSFSGVGSSFFQESGTVQVEFEGGFIFADGTFTYNGGTIAGWPANLYNARLVIGPSAAPPTQGFLLYTGNMSLGSDVPAGFKLLFRDGSWDFGSDTGHTNYGEITLQNITLDTKSGMLTNAVGGMIDVTDASRFKGKFDNQGTLSLHANLTTSETSTYTNNGSIAIYPGVSLSISGAAPVFNQSGGSIFNSGSLSLTNGSFNYLGGTISGVEPLLTNVSLNFGAGAGDGSFVQTGAGSTLSGSIQSGQQLRVEDGTLTISSNLRNAGTIRTSGASGVTIRINNAMLNNAAGGTISTGTSGGGTQISGTLNNAGTLTIGDSTGLTYTTPGGSLTNAGRINLPTDKTLTIASGTLNMSGGSIVGGGNLQIQPGATLSGSGALAANLSNAGMLSPGTPIGTLSINGADSLAANPSNAGTLSSSAQIGTLSISGSYTQSATGVLNIDMSGSGQPGEIDQVSVSGEANLGGVLNIRIAAGFQCANGDQFPIISYAARSDGSDFASVNVSGADTMLLDHQLSAQGVSIRIIDRGAAPEYRIYIPLLKKD
jgi:hypothetical protein